MDCEICHHYPGQTYNITGPHIGVTLEKCMQECKVADVCDLFTYTDSSDPDQEFYQIST